MEVNYYYDLGKLGLIDAKKNVEFVTKTSNKKMLADAYNFVGLFEFLIGDYTGSISTFKTASKFIDNAPKLPYTSTEIHHIQNNISESFFQIGQLDSALHYATLSMANSKKAKNYRSFSLSLHLLSDIYKAQNNLEKSNTSLDSAYKIAHQKGFNDVALICLGRMSQHTTISIKDRSEAIAEGFTLLEKNPNINPLYKKLFLSDALIYFQNGKNYQKSTEVLSNLLNLEEQKNEKEINYLNLQYQEIITNTERRLASE